MASNLSQDLAQMATNIPVIGQPSGQVVTSTIGAFEIRRPQIHRPQIRRPQIRRHCRKLYSRAYLYNSNYVPNTTIKGLLMIKAFLGYLDARSIRLGCACLAVFFAFTGCESKSTSEKAIENAGYKDYSDKGPFHILVDSKYPTDQTMLLLSDSEKARMVVFGFDDEDGAAIPSRKAKVSIAGKVSAQIRLDQQSKPEELDLLLTLPGQPQELLQDINLDGQWDIKYMLQTGEYFIWFEGKWLLVTKLKRSPSLFEAESSNGSFVFDMKKGQWATK
jgi:hypothetical protein